MTATLIPNPDDQRITEQLALANAMRERGMAGKGGQGMAGNVYMVGNQWGNLAQTLGGAYLGNKATNERQALNDTRNKQYADAMAAMPSATEQREAWTPEQMAAGPTQEAPTMQALPKSARQLQQENTQWIAGLPNIPQFAGVKQFGLQQALTAPEKQAAQEAALDERKEARLDKANEAFRLQAQREEDNLRRDRERAQDRADNMRLAASLRPAPAPRNQQFLQTDQGIFAVGPGGDLTPAQFGDKQLTKTPAAAGDRVSAAEKKAVTEAKIGIASIDDAIEKVNDPKAKDAFGLANLMPGAETIRQYSNPEGVDARAAVANIGSLKLHDRSGAAVTAAEFPRLRPFIPNQFDKPETIVKKLTGMKEEYQRIQDEWTSGRNTSGNGGALSVSRTPIIRPGAKPAASPDAEYEAWKKANGLQ